MKTTTALEILKKYLRCHEKECPYNCATCEDRVLPREMEEALWALIKKIEANGGEVFHLEPDAPAPQKPRKNKKDRKK